MCKKKVKYENKRRINQQIEIFNAHGQLVYQEQIEITANQTSLEIILSYLPNALYMIKDTGECGVKVGKVVKN
ncbi:T9SS type A sorting domain-containing protein [candidate division KSB1 bacterium]